MPVIVIGADTSLGADIVTALSRREGELRAFVTDEVSGALFRSAGVRVAVGDVSDGSHIAGAAFGCFSAVLVTEAASDTRERSFLTGRETVLSAWADAVTEAGVSREIWVGEAPPLRSEAESAVVTVADRSPADIASEIAAIDDRPLGAR